MSDRRSFLTGLIAVGFCPTPTWAEAGSPAFLSAAMNPDGTYVLCGLSDTGDITFEIPLPARGHAAAAHPTLAEAVAFARRPGRFALVIDCVTGRESARLEAPPGRHFYGHGTFSADGSLLFTTENDYEAGEGIIGVWDARTGFSRIDEFPSGGVGPHDVHLMPDGQTLVIANGGIETHPESGRSKLNIATMRPNLSFADLNGHIVDQHTFGPEFHKNSIRHLAVARNGTVAVAMQWQGDMSDHPPLLGLHVPGRHMELIAASDAVGMHGYAGSIAVSRDGAQIAITSPRGGVFQVFDTASQSIARQGALEDVCGVAARNAGFVLTTGTGRVGRETPSSGLQFVDHARAWDNHLIPIAGAPG